MKCPTYTPSVSVMLHQHWTLKRKPSSIRGIGVLHKVSPLHLRSHSSSLYDALLHVCACVVPRSHFTHFACFLHIIGLLCSPYRANDMFVGVDVAETIPHHVLLSALAPPQPVQEYRRGLSKHHELWCIKSKAQFR
ncbi:Uncharacterized protein HZ326_1785 [Fusarium oxysporum f. sp. albedinis]|nr:Uncharacterized protein HZ326_1785 [Fusarium oxysporum f. sp. albedinis]